jgi:hypothetical protein
VRPNRPCRSQQLLLRACSSIGCNKGFDSGATQEQRDLVAHWHGTKEHIPKNGVVIDSTAPIARVVDEIVRQGEAKTIS